MRSVLVVKKKALAAVQCRGAGSLSNDDMEDCAGLRAPTPIDLCQFAYSGRHCEELTEPKARSLLLQWAGFSSP
jgi:hypothetical protein